MSSLIYNEKTKNKVYSSHGVLTYKEGIFINILKYYNNFVWITYNCT